MLVVREWQPAATAVDYRLRRNKKARDYELPFESIKRTPVRCQVMSHPIRKMWRGCPAPGQNKTPTVSGRGRGLVARLRASVVSLVSAALGILYHSCVGVVTPDKHLFAFLLTVLEMVDNRSPGQRDEPT